MVNIIGLDFGNEITKAVDESQRISFSTKVREGAAIIGDTFNYNGKDYVIGEGQHDTEYNKLDKKYLMHCIYAALDKMNLGPDNYIATGLPIGQYQKNKDMLKDRILSEGTGYISSQGVLKVIKIKDVLVLPEGLGAVRNDFQGIVLDIGGRTSDIALIKNENGRRRVINPQSIGKGTLNLYSDIAKAISSRYNIDYKSDDVDTIFKNGLFIDGVEQDSKFIVELLKTFTEDLINIMNLEYNLRVNSLAVAGGGGALFFNAIQRRVKQAELVKDPFYANANYYYWEGLRQWL